MLNKYITESIKYTHLFGQNNNLFSFVHIGTYHMSFVQLHFIIKTAYDMSVHDKFRSNKTTTV